MAIFTKCNICEKPDQEIIGSGMFQDKELKICITCFEKQMAMLDFIEKTPYAMFERKAPVYYTLPGETEK